MLRPRYVAPCAHTLATSKGSSMSMSPSCSTSQLTAVSGSVALLKWMARMQRWVGKPMPSSCSNSAGSTSAGTFKYCRSKAVA